jgi:hypothetical protein
LSRLHPVKQLSPLHQLQENVIRVLCLVEVLCFDQTWLEENKPSVQVGFKSQW